MYAMYAWMVPPLTRHYNSSSTSHISKHTFRFVCWWTHRHDKYNNLSASRHRRCALKSVRSRARSLTRTHTLSFSPYESNGIWFGGVDIDCDDDSIVFFNTFVLVCAISNGNHGARKEGNMWAPVVFNIYLWDCGPIGTCFFNSTVLAREIQTSCKTYILWWYFAFADNAVRICSTPSSLCRMFISIGIHSWFACRSRLFPAMRMKTKKKKNKTTAQQSTGHKPHR